MSAVTRLLDAAAGGDPAAADELLPLVYDELRRLAAARLAAEKPGQTLQATALVHEAYLRLVGGADPGWNGRGHFFAAAAEAMRRILVDAARRKRAEKHGGTRARADLRDVPAAADLPPDDLLDLDAALTAFEAEEPEKAALVRLRFFAGLPEAEAAACLGLSRATASRHWAYARAWLLDRLGGADNP
jgi:RNA polymerase sigma factor (TIGR02999 family)